jgi:hypothetical protein
VVDAKNYEKPVVAVQESLDMMNMLEKSVCFKQLFAICTTLNSSGFLFL